MVDPSAVPPAVPAPATGPGDDGGPSPSTRRPRDRVATAAVLLIAVGLLLFAVHAVTAGGQRHSYSADSTAPTSVSLVAGEQYTISVHGGVRSSPALTDPTTLSCEIGTGDGATTALTVTAESATTKATNQVGRFLAPLSGRATVTCAGLPAVFVDDAEDAGADLSGLALLLGLIALTVGLPLLCSVLRRHFSPEPTPV